jgi:hypothetical protein
MPKLTSAKLDQIINDYKEKPSVDTMGAAFEALWRLANNIIKFVNFKGVEKAFKDKINTTSYMVAFAFIKIERYDPTKGKAFNFFTTIMLSWLRQVYRSNKNYSELKAKYEKSKNTRSSRQKLHSCGK